MNDLGIIIQARLGSTRLPKKMIKPFFNNKSVLEIILEKLTENFSEKIILATTTNIIDDAIVEIAKKYNVIIYRGSEHNVLERFVSAMKYAKVTSTIRVCADNPFIDVAFIKALISVRNKEKHDYISYSLDGVLPVIKSHIGFFAEYVTSDALKKACHLTSEKVYLEHVTNFLYENPTRFKIQLLDVPFYLKNRTDLRFTMDTVDDFNLLKELYAFCVRNNYNTEKMVSFVDKSPEIREKMRLEILKHKK